MTKEINKKFPRMRKKEEAINSVLEAHQKESRRTGRYVFGHKKEKEGPIYFVEYYGSTGMLFKRTIISSNYNAITDHLIDKVGCDISEFFHRKKECV